MMRLAAEHERGACFRTRYFDRGAARAAIRHQTHTRRDITRTELVAWRCQACGGAWHIGRAI